MGDRGNLSRVVEVVSGGQREYVGIGNANRQCTFHGKFID